MLVHQSPVRLLSWRAGSVEHVDKAHIACSPSPPRETEGVPGPAGVRAFVDVIVHLVETEQSALRPSKLLLRPRYASPYGAGFARPEREGQLAPMVVLHPKTSEPIPAGGLTKAHKHIVACELQSQGRVQLVAPLELHLPLPPKGGHFTFPYELAGPPLRTAQDPSFHFELSWLDLSGAEGTSCWRDGDEMTILLSKLTQLG